MKCPATHIHHGFRCTKNIFIFQNSLGPGDETNVRFSKIGKNGLELNKVEGITMRIFITDNSSTICNSPILKETFKDCLMN